MEENKISEEEYYVCKTMDLGAAIALVLLGILYIIFSIKHYICDSVSEYKIANAFLFLGVFIFIISLLPVLSFYKLKRKHSKINHWTSAIVNVIITYVVYKYCFSLLMFL